MSQFEQQAQPTKQGMPFSLLIIFMLVAAIIVALIVLFFQNGFFSSPTQQISYDQVLEEESPSPTPISTPIPNESQPIIPLTAPIPTASPTPEPTPNPTPEPSPVSVQPTTSLLDGTLHLQGDIPPNADILLLVREKGTTEYQTLGRYQAQRQVDWSWSGAKTNQIYEVKFALQIDQDNLHTSPLATAKAPATIEVWMNTTD